MTEDRTGPGNADYLRTIDEGVVRLRDDITTVEGALLALCREIFTTPRDSFFRLLRVADRRGVDRAVALAENRGGSGARAMIGFMRGGLFRPGQRRVAERAIPLLTAALGRRDDLRRQLRTLEASRYLAVERADQDRLWQLAGTLAHTRNNPRSPASG